MFRTEKPNNGIIIPFQRVDKPIDRLADQEKGRDILPK